MRERQTSLDAIVGRLVSLDNNWKGKRNTHVAEGKCKHQLIFTQSEG